MEKVDTLHYCKILWEKLNEEFQFEIEPHLNSKNYIMFKAIRGKAKWAKRYIIVNNTILQISDNAKTYTYQINGQAGKNTKEVMQLDIGIEINQIRFEFEKYVDSIYLAKGNK